MKEERRKKKLIKNKPFSTLLFCPPSPGSHLAKELRMIVEEETRERLHIFVFQRKNHNTQTI